MVQSYALWNHSANGIGEGFRFFFKSAIRLLFKEYALLGAATVQLIELSSSIDSTILARSLGIFTEGIKLIDVGCKYSITGEFINITSSESCLVQIRENCFLQEIILVKDSSET